MTLPKLTIVTPSFNSVNFIEATIESVIGQRYPDLEYLVYDGGSTDGTVDILRRQSEHIKWKMEPDEGQSDAINKGLRGASGEIVSWINSNDIYLPGSFDTVAHFFVDHPEVGVVFGRVQMLDSDGMVRGEYQEGGTIDENLAANLIASGHYLKLLKENSGWMPQQSVFWRRSLMERAGYLDPKLHFAMDYEYWLRLGRLGTIHFVNAWLGGFRLHEQAKSANARKLWREILAVDHAYGGPLFSKLHEKFLQECIRAVGRRMHVVQRTSRRD